jgi:hypothetical protein
MIVMNNDVRLRAITAIIEQHSAAYNTPSGAILTLLTELASEGNLPGLSEVYNLFAEARSDNALFVRNHVPAKVLNGYLLGLRQLDVAAFQKWEALNPDWPRWITVNLSDPAKFKRSVLDIEQAIAAGR